MLTHKSSIYPWHCDHMGHMNVMYYVNKFDEATWELFAAIGLTRGFLAENNRGMAAVEQVIRYKKEVVAGDVIEIDSELKEVRNKGIKFVHRMRDSTTGSIVAETDLFGLFIDTGLRRAVSFPEAILAKLRAHAGPADA